jgi:hypothetical protein
VITEESNQWSEKQGEDRRKLGVGGIANKKNCAVSLPTGKRLSQSDIDTAIVLDFEPAI